LRRGGCSRVPKRQKVPLSFLQNKCYPALGNQNVRFILNSFRRKASEGEPPHPHEDCPPPFKTVRLRKRLVPVLLGLLSVAGLMGYLCWPGHLLPGDVDVDLHIEGFEYREEDTVDGPQRLLFARVRATNRSGHTLRYLGLIPGHPDWALLEFRDGRWLPHWRSTTPGETWVFDDGETFVFYAMVDSRAAAVIVQVRFASSWLGRMDRWAASDEQRVERPSAIGED
jgi:hypothetical protein